VLTEHARIAQELALYGSSSASFSIGSIHCTITIEKDGEKILEEYHAGVMTQQGLNQTLGKLTANFTAAGYNSTSFPMNITHVCIGNDTGTLGATSINLPNEWNKTAGTHHDKVYNSFNITAVFTGAEASQTADCIGLCYDDTINDGSLFCYDTFSEVTGIDSTFTITVEFKVSIS
jgi:hypothetical protein